jgi:hypothetical protein
MNINNNFILIKQFLNENVINSYLENSVKYSEYDSKVGTRICFEKKIRKDIFFTDNECIVLDEIICNLNKNLIKEEFGINIKYREKYKLGTYYDNGGFYIPHTDTQGNMEHRKISMVICLSNKENYEGGIFKFIDLKNDFKLDKGDAIFFRSELLHGVEPVISGKRQVLISFLWDDEGEQIRKSITPVNIYLPILQNIIVNLNLSNNLNIKNKYIYPILADSGPGNQIIGIKECLILSKLLNKICIIPPIRTHYLISNDIFYNFNSIYNLKSFDIIIDNIPSKITNIENIYVINEQYLNVKLRNDKLLKYKCKDTLLNCKLIKTYSDISELQKMNDNVLIIKHLFNNILISNCNINGCYKCGFNKVFFTLYKNICNNLDFSNEIKIKGDTFINTYLGDKFISIHLRYPDVMSNKNLSQFTNNLYDENILYNKINKKYSEYKIFISTNKQHICKKTKLNKFIYFNEKNNPFFSWIDQYICCKSDLFFYSPFNQFDNIDKLHQRSTFSSFIIDYRLFYLYKYEKDNINLIDM